MRRKQYKKAKRLAEKTARAGGEAGDGVEKERKGATTAEVKGK